MRPNFTGQTNHKLQISIQPNIGLNAEAWQSIVERLNHVLADEVVLTTKTRCAQWNVHGGDFFALRLHEKIAWALRSYIEAEPTNYFNIGLDPSVSAWILRSNITREHSDHVK